MYSTLYSLLGPALRGMRERKGWRRCGAYTLGLGPSVDGRTTRGRSKEQNWNS